MATLIDFSIGRYEDGVLSISMNPPVPIGGWNIQFIVAHRFGSTSGYIFKNVASGFNGQSGITITNSGQGVFNVNVNSQDSSGLDFGNYAFCATRLDSGARTAITEGYMMLTPTI